MICLRNFWATNHDLNWQKHDCDKKKEKQFNEWAHIVMFKKWRTQ